MALVSTELKLASDFFQAVANFLGPKYEESKSKAHDLTADATAAAKHYQAVAAETVDEARKTGAEQAKRAQAEVGKRVQGQQ